MHGFVRGFESSIFGILAGAAGASGRHRQPETQVRVIRQTSRRSIDQLIAALTAEERRADRLAAENADLRRRLSKANETAMALMARKRQGS